MIIKSESKQTTISKKVSLKGVGLHTGLEVEINFLPADINNGYTIREIMEMRKCSPSLVSKIKRGVFSMEEKATPI